MRNTIRYAADQLARYNGDINAAQMNTRDYFVSGGLSYEYYTDVLRNMRDMNLVNNKAPAVQYMHPRYVKQLVKAIRKTMPRVHTEVSNWRLIYHDLMADAVSNRKLGRRAWALSDLRSARHIRQMYL